MLYDLERVLEYKHPLEETAVPMDGGLIWDPQLKNLAMGDMAHASKMRGILDRIIRSITIADVVVMTLGMTETWSDSATGAILPTPPGPLQIRKHPERFRYFAASYSNIIDTVSEIIKKIDAYCPKKPRIIITVSPVPMGSTFTDKDVIVANSRSKATLVAAAQTTASLHDHVDYFPSYEMVTNSAREIWYEDMIHIREEYVAQIMSRFVSAYFPPEVTA
jgi:hypothetical protein